MKPERFTDSVKFWVLIVIALAVVLSWIGYKISYAIVQSSVDTQSYMKEQP